MKFPAISVMKVEPNEMYEEELLENRVVIACRVSKSKMENMTRIVVSVGREKVVPFVKYIMAVGLLPAFCRRSTDGAAELTLIVSSKDSRSCPVDMSALKDNNIGLVVSGV